MSIPIQIKAKCESHLATKIIQSYTISGGDINEARLIETKSQQYFLKYNSGLRAFDMLNSELKGLTILSAQKAIKTPNIHLLDTAGEYAFLLMEYIPSGEKKRSSWSSFGECLANLHRQSAPQFGLDHDNFIGSLPQCNKQSNNWIEFFIECRLQYQIDLAKDKIPSSLVHAFDIFYPKLIQLLPNEIPALIHGDLWNGNFIIDEKGEAVLIDPSVSFANREMDLAMTLLFGGFHAKFYESYKACFPLISGFEKRYEIYQLYYLMVHVNLFGGSYISSVQRILDKYN